MIIPDHIKMKPIIVLSPDAMDEQSIKDLKENGLCVVVAKDPSSVKFLDPIPAVSQRTLVEQAAISLSRKLMSQGFWNDNTTRRAVCETYFDILSKGTSLDPKVDSDKKLFDQTKSDEIQKIAREEAREEAAAKKPARNAAKK